MIIGNTYPFLPLAGRIKSNDFSQKITAHIVQAGREYTQAYAANFETRVFETYDEVKQRILCGHSFSGDRLDIIGPLIEKFHA